jgi:hypothetical protein
MASYKNMLELIRQGKSPEEILKTLSLRPSDLRRILTSKRLNAELELERDISRKIAARDIGSAVHEMVGRCRAIALDGNNETARKAAEGLLEMARQKFERTPSQDLLVSLVRKGQLPQSVLYGEDQKW